MLASLLCIVAMSTLQMPAVHGDVARTPPPPPPPPSIDAALYRALDPATTDAPTILDCAPQHCGCRMRCEPVATPKRSVEIVMYTRSWFITYSKDMYPALPGTLECPTTMCKVTYGPSFQPTTDVLLMVHDEFPAKRRKEKLHAGQFFAMMNLEPIIIPSETYQRGRVDVLITHQTQNAGDFPVLPQAYAVGSEHRLRAPIVPFSNRLGRIPVWISNPNRIGYDRLAIIAELARYLPVLSIFPINHTLPMDMARDFPMCRHHTERKVVHDYNRRTFEKECALRFSRVTLAFESFQYENYMTEKVAEPLRSGCVPVYIGAPNVKQLLPHPSAAIHMADFASVKDAAAYIYRAISEEAVWASHQEWRRRPFSPGFDAILKTQTDGVFCQLCEWVSEQRARNATAS